MERRSFLKGLASLAALAAVPVAAIKVVEAAAAPAARHVMGSCNVVAGQTYTFSIYARKADGPWKRYWKTFTADKTELKTWYLDEIATESANQMDINGDWFEANAAHVGEDMRLWNAEVVDETPPSTEYVSTSYSAAGLPQVEEGAFPTSYISTEEVPVTRPADQYVIEYDAATGSHNISFSSDPVPPYLKNKVGPIKITNRGLLVEESRTNLLTHSNRVWITESIGNITVDDGFSNAAWTAVLFPCARLELHNSVAKTATLMIGCRCFHL